MRCGNNIAGVNSPERNTVDFERAGNKENTLLECLQENDTLATESASKEDQDGAGGESCSRS